MAKQPTRIDGVLQAVGLGVALLRVLRGDKPETVIAETTAMTERAERLSKEIEQYMGRPND